MAASFECKIAGRVLRWMHSYHGNFNNQQTSASETRAAPQDYLEWRWNRMDPTLGPVPTDPFTVAKMRPWARESAPRWT